MASSVTKKNSLCRYYIRYGDCFHGENCQFIHAHPPQEQAPSQPVASVEPPPPPTPVPQVQNAPQAPPMPQQQGYNMSKLVCSFKSDLPNEIDFAMQVSTLLANTDNFTWFKDYPLVDAICSSLHVFICICGDTSNCYCYPRFWHKILIKNSANIYLQAATVPPDMGLTYLDFNSLKDHDTKDQGKIYRRIKTAAELIKQFSMTTGVSRNEKNELATNTFNYHQMKKKKLKASPSLLKFVSLLLHCDDTPLNLIGLDILSNTASKLSKIPEASDDVNNAKLVQMFQDYCADCISRQDGDIYVVNRSVEVISRLISSSNRRVSTNITNLITERNLVLRVEQFLTSHYDVTLFLSALECCYRISRHQPHLLTAGRARFLLKILVNLLNCDDNRYFTPTALKRIKLIDEEELTVQYLTPLDETPKVETSRKSLDPTRLPNNNKPNQQTNHRQQPQSKPQPYASSQVQANAHTQSPAQAKQNSDRTERPSIAQSVSSNSTVPSIKSTQLPADKAHIFSSSAQPSTYSKQPSTNSAQPLRNSTPVSSNSLTQTTNSSRPAVNASQPSALPLKDYACEWDGCSARFSHAKQVYPHVFEVHIGPLAPDSLSSCLWSGPNGSGPGCLTKRPKYSLLTHLDDFHCNPVALERVINRSQPVKPPEHPGYAPNAALVAIRRHANSHVEGSNGTRNLRQSPLSISVRLTAALILRNLAKESPEMKQALENHEPLLSEICMSIGRDESKIIAECLSLFSND